MGKHVKILYIPFVDEKTFREDAEKKIAELLDDGGQVIASSGGPIVTDAEVNIVGSKAKFSSSHKGFIVFAKD